MQVPVSLLPRQPLSTLASMLGALALNSAIENTRNILPYSQWTIGVTDDYQRRWSEHGRPSVWFCWHVVHGRTSRMVEENFIQKGMKGGDGGGGNAAFLYVFLNSSVKRLPWQ